MVKTLLGLRTPPVATYVVKMMNIISDMDTTMKPRLAARTSPAHRMRRDSRLHVHNTPFVGETTITQLLIAAHMKTSQLLLCTIGKKLDIVQHKQPSTKFLQS